MYCHIASEQCRQSMCTLEYNDMLQMYFKNVYIKAEQLDWYLNDMWCKIQSIVIESLLGRLH